MTTDGKSPRIFLVRLSAIGDVIHGMPVAVALREHFPRAFLAWAVEQRAADLLDGHPAIDQRIVLPRRLAPIPCCRLATAETTPVAGLRYGH